MKLPGFTAEVSLYQTSTRTYINLSPYTVSGTGEVLPQIMIGGDELPFSCDRESCECKGLEDCVDLGKTGLCDSKIWACSGSVCICKRK